MTEGSKGHSPMYTQHLLVLLNDQKLLVVLVDPVPTALGSLLSQSGLLDLCSTVRLSIFPQVKISMQIPMPKLDTIVTEKKKQQSFPEVPPKFDTPGGLYKELLYSMRSWVKIVGSSG